MISSEELVGKEWAEWYSMTPMERWRESGRLWELYLAMGGSLDPEPTDRVLSSIQTVPIHLLLMDGENFGS
jgi:hypothetical protein